MRRNRSKTVSSFLAVAVVASFNSVVQAETFPYLATVKSNTALVHSGPGKKYYSTQRLKQGAKVQVLRHDRGGWYMVTPPQGSFSLVRADKIRVTAQGKGVVISNDVIAWVGSSTSQSTDVMQEQLLQNDSVRIFGVTTIVREGEKIKMYKIVPPRNERRWIKADAFKAVTTTSAAQDDDDPFSVVESVSLQEETASKKSSDDILLVSGESEKIQPLFPTTKSESTKKTTDKKSTSEGVRRRGPAVEQLAERRQKLRELDRQLTAIISKEKTEWEFSALEAGYKALAAEYPDSVALQSKLGMRAATIKRYKNIKKAYDDFIQLTSATTARDEELRVQQEQGVVNQYLNTPSELDSQLPTTLPVDAGRDTEFGLQSSASQTSGSQSSTGLTPVSQIPTSSAGSQTIIQSSGTTVSPQQSQNANPQQMQMVAPQQGQYPQLQMRDPRMQHPYSYRQPNGRQQIYQPYGYRQRTPGMPNRGGFGQPYPYRQRFAPHQFPQQRYQYQQNPQQQLQQQQYQPRPYQPNSSQRYQPQAAAQQRLMQQRGGNAYYPVRRPMPVRPQQMVQPEQNVPAGYSPQSTPQPIPQPQQRLPQTPATLQPQIPAAALQPQGPSAFQGKGIIRRISGSGGNMPPHALVADDGRVIGFLQAPKGTNLDQWVNKSVGIQGQRSHRAEWHADAIVIQNVSAAQ